MRNFKVGLTLILIIGVSGYFFYPYYQINDYCRKLANTQEYPNSDLPHYLAEVLHEAGATLTPDDKLQLNKERELKFSKCRVRLLTKI